MGKWRTLALKLQAQEEPCDNSDISDNSPPNVTSVTNVTDLDPLKTEREAIQHFDGKLPREWAEAFAKLQFIPRPERYSLGRWEQIINDAGLFADRWAGKAIKLGWTIQDVFAVHKSENTGRLDGDGVILSLRGNTVIALTADHIMVETPTGSRQRISRPTADLTAIKTILHASGSAPK